MRFTMSKIMGGFDGQKACDALRALGVEAELKPEGDNYKIEVDIADNKYQHQIAESIASFLDATDLIIALNRRQET